MEEGFFWSALEYRISREFNGLKRKHYGALWCDGLAPVAYYLTDDPPRIEGEAWIGYDQTTIWKFTLFLPQPVDSLRGIDWESLIPAEELTQWLAIDEPRRILQIEPAAARLPEE